MWHEFINFRRDADPIRATLGPSVRTTVTPDAGHVVPPRTYLPAAMTTFDVRKRPFLTHPGFADACHAPDARLL